MVDTWNGLPNWVVTANTNTFKSRLDKLCQNQDIVCNFKAQLHGTESRSIVVWEEFLASYSIVNYKANYSIVKWYEDAGIDAPACDRLLSVGLRLPKHWAVEPFRLALSNRNSSRSRRGVERGEWSEAGFCDHCFEYRVSRASNSRFYTFYTATLRTRTALVIWATTDSGDV